MKKVMELLKRQCRRAVALGGGVAGEHGIGKMYRDLVGIQWSDKEINKMREIKRRFDPNQILGRGNILPA
jgi:FAD/FMN-containing dehydrogenase